MPQNLLGMTRSELEAFVGGLGAKPYRARQLLKIADLDFQ